MSNNYHILIMKQLNAALIKANWTGISMPPFAHHEYYIKHKESFSFGFQPPFFNQRANRIIGKDTKSPNPITAISRGIKGTYSTPKWTPLSIILNTYRSVTNQWSSNRIQMEGKHPRHSVSSGISTTTRTTKCTQTLTSSEGMKTPQCVHKNIGGASTEACNLASTKASKQNIEYWITGYEI